MDQNINAFDKVFQDKLAQHAVPPPPNMLSGIQAGLAQKKNNRKAFWLIITDASIMLLFLLFSGFAMFSGADDHLPGETAALETMATEISTNSIPSDDPEGQAVTSKTEDFSSEIGSTDPGEMASELSDLKSEDAGDLSKYEVLKSGSSITEKARSENATSTIESSIDQEIDKAALNQPSVNDLNFGLEDEVQKNSSLSLEGNSAFGGKERMMASKMINPPFSMDKFEPVFNDSLLDVQDVEEKSDDHEVFAGLQLNLHTPLIFNQNTHNVFGGKELAYKPTFGVASGLRLGYTYKRHYGVELGYVFYSKQGQHYSEILNGMSAQRQVNLNYMHIPILLRYKFEEKATKKVSSPWVINLGMQIGILQSASITHTGNEYPLTEIPNAETNDKDYFKPTDLSVVFGVEKEIYLNRFLLMGLGLRTTYSGDINAEDWPVLKDVDAHGQSHNFTFAFTVSLNYYRRFK